MQDNPFLQDLYNEPLALAHAPAKLGGGPNQ